MVLIKKLLIVKLTITPETKYLHINNKTVDILFLLGYHIMNTIRDYTCIVTSANVTDKILPVKVCNPFMKRIIIIYADYWKLLNIYTKYPLTTFLDSIKYLHLKIDDY